MSVHLEEPDPDGEALEPSGSHIWWSSPGVALRDMRGSVLVVIPQRCAWMLAGFATKEEFAKKHAAGELNMPLLCHARLQKRSDQRRRFSACRIRESHMGDGGAGLVGCVVSAQRSLH